MGRIFKRNRVRSGLAQTFNCLEDEAEKIGRFFLTVAERMKRKKVRK